MARNNKNTSKNKEASAQQQQQQQQENQIPAETRALNPVNGQILNDIDEALNAVVDLKGEKIDFKRNEDIKNDIVYTGEGSDGKTYTVQLEKKTVLVSVYNTPKPEEEGKITKKSASENKPSINKKPAEEKQDLNKIVEDLDKPLLEKEEGKK